MTTKGRRTIDRARRQRILDGALAVIGRDGVEGLSHRRVAEEAGVPISAACYYFSSIENLLLCVMREAAAQDLAALRQRFENTRPTRDELPGMLAEHLAEQVRSQRVTQVAVVELYVAALRRPELREVAEEWNETLFALIAPHGGQAAATAVALVCAGLIQQMLLSETPVDARELEPPLRAALGLNTDVPTPAVAGT